MAVTPEKNDILDGGPSIEFEGGEIVKLGKMDSICIVANKKRKISDGINTIVTRLIGCPID